MILGIGFILIAGIFPVAINQTQANGDETIAASTARQGAAVVASMANTSTLMAADGNVHRFGPSATPTTVPFGDPDLALWNGLNGSQVLSEDPRYAWIPFYCRNTDANKLPNDFAQITIIAVRVRNHAAYIPSANTGGDEHVTGTGATAAATLIGTEVDGVTLNASTNLAIPDTITFPRLRPRARPLLGPFVIIAFDSLAAKAALAAAQATPPVPYSGSAVGWVLKIGDPTGTPGIFNLQPGGDIKNQRAKRLQATGRRHLLRVHCRTRRRPRQRRHIQRRTAGRDGLHHDGPPALT